MYALDTYVKVPFKFLRKKYGFLKFHLFAFFNIISYSLNRLLLTSPFWDGETNRMNHDTNMTTLLANSMNLCFNPRSLNSHLI